jgi:hypothetical protein
VFRDQLVAEVFRFEPLFDPDVEDFVAARGEEFHDAASDLSLRCTGHPSTSNVSRSPKDSAQSLQKLRVRMKNYRRA